MTSYNQISGQRIIRVEALSDGVFAIAMTILVLDLVDQNATKNISEKELLAALTALLPKFLSFFLSFLTLGIFWIGQMTQYDFINKYNRKLTWFTVMFLMFISVLPFTTTILSNHFSNKVSILLYWINILFIGIISWFHWEIAVKQSFLNIAGQEKKNIIKLFRNRVLTAQILYAFGAALCFINTKLSIIFIIVVQINIAFSIFTIKKRLPKNK